MTRWHTHDWIREGPHAGCCRHCHAFEPDDDGIEELGVEFDIDPPPQVWV